MKPEVFVFYAGQLIGQFSVDHYRQHRVSCTPEIYNGAFVYRLVPPPRYVPAAQVPLPRQDPGWFRMDGTPVLDSDVPPELKLTVLLLGP